MAASVRIEDEAFSDLRIDHLGVLLGTNKFDALGRMAHLWRQCTMMGTYQLPLAMVSSVITSEWLVDAGLAEPAGDGFLRIKGTEGRIEWLDAKRKSARAGGIARAKSAKRGKGGRFGSSKPPASAGDAGTSTQPAESSAPAPAPAPASSLSKDREGGTRRASAIPANWEPTERHREQASELGLSANTEAAKFRDYWLAEGKAKKDWNAAFRNWLRKASEYQRQRQRTTGPQRPKLERL